MPDFLDPDRAAALARRLKAIKGYPWDDAATEAVAECLMKWCKGFIEGSRVWKAEEQAEECIGELIMRCAEEALEWEGIGQLKAVFNERFKPRETGPSQEEQWRKMYGPPDTQWSQNFAARIVKNRLSPEAFKEQLKESMKEAIRDSLYYTEGKGRFELEPRHGDGEERRKEKRQSQEFWANAMRHHNEKHPQEVAEARLQLATSGGVQ